MRRSPAEFHIRYRLIELADVPVDQIAAQLADDLEPVDEPYLQKLRRQMPIPDGFDPADLRNVVSQESIRRWGIWSAFHPSRAMREASEAYEKLHVRRAVQLLLASGAGDDLTLALAAQDLRVVLTAEGLAQFRHFYFNMALMARPELVRHARERLQDHELALLATMPPGPSTTRRALLVLGLAHGHVEVQRMLEDHLDRLDAAGSASAWCMTPGPAQAAALHHVGESMVKTQTALAAIAPPGDRLDELRGLIVATRTTQETTLAELRAGRPPFPVVSLLPLDDRGDDDDDA
jgi:hypothetical protein